MTGATQPNSTIAPELRTALRACRKALIGVGMVSGLINLLMLTGPLFMLQIYDRVLPSRSLPTLVGLSLLALTLFGFQGLLEAVRARVLVRIGLALDDELSPRVFDIVMRSAALTHAVGDGLQPLRDLGSVRSVLSNVALTALFDLPWMPLYVAICFLIHPWLGGTVLLGAGVLCSLAFLTEVLTRAPSRELVALATTHRALAETARRNAAVIRALGMRGRMAERWAKENAAFLERQQSISDLSTGLGSVSRMLRMILQSGVLGLGAYLVINQEATGGVMLAATVLTARALAPVELAISNWKTFVSARQGWRRLSEVLSAIPCEEKLLKLPPPRQSLRLIGVSLAAPGSTSAVLHDVSLALGAGSALGVIGPTGSGKSSLARALVGVWKPVRGVIRLDGATLDQWAADELGKFIGYLPQEVEVFEGTVAQNIARFATDAEPVRLIAAAKAAGVHEVILRLPNGYETQIGEAGARLSGGQRQHVALARALYGDPFIVVLDEPNANLDAEGERALTRAIHGIRARGGIAIVIAHRPSAVIAVDLLLILNEGRVQTFGTREQILRQSQHAAQHTIDQTRKPAGVNGGVSGTSANKVAHV